MLCSPQAGRVVIILLCNGREGGREGGREVVVNVLCMVGWFHSSQMISYTDFMEISEHVSEKCRYYVCVCVCVCVGAQVQILKFTECLRLGRNVLTHEYNIALNFVQYSAHQFLLVHNDYMTTCKVFTVTSC